jgi:protein phosphatase
VKADSFGCATDVGRARDHNEDNFAARPDLGLWIVADGMGGHEAGEVASAVAVEVIPEEVSVGNPLAEAVERAHEAIVRAGREGRGAPGMGCTVVALKAEGCDYEIAWVGDSRAYLWDGSRLRPLTRDHSFVQQMIDAGALTEEEARTHPQRSVITQALGVHDHGGVRVDTVRGSLGRGESILLCSDGLTGEVEDGQIARLLTAEGDATQKVRALIEAANANGGSDNITVILVEAPEDAPAKACRGGTVPFDAAALNRKVGKKKKRPRLWLVVVIFAALAALGGYLFTGSEKPAPASAGAGSAAPSAAVLQPAEVPRREAPSVPELSVVIEESAEVQESVADSAPSDSLPKQGEERPVPPSEMRSELEGEEVADRQPGGESALSGEESPLPDDGGKNEGSRQ